ncbi:Stomagen, C-terminal domain [Dillenia turbinata]|uniref:Stomagen, C-terminal domain n=1 Tax=Dillenia turbinata TaxID=194707 RepID=A0AAN8W5U3_9MAGN
MQGRQGDKAEAAVPHQSVPHLFPSQKIARLQSSERIWVWTPKNSRRLMIGSTAPTCTYNECRGCKYRCRAEQVPVEGNDPINSAYHYRCVCHR